MTRDMFRSTLIEGRMDVNRNRVTFGAGGTWEWLHFGNLFVQIFIENPFGIMSYQGENRTRIM